jgi:nucleoid DNA-binding protein
MSAKKKTAHGMTKVELVAKLASDTGLTKTQISNVFDCMSSLIASELKAGRSVTIPPGLAKISRNRRAATKARTGRNPSTGEPLTIKAKPAHDVIGIKALKGLKDMA